MARVKYSKLASNDLFEYSEFIAHDKPVAAYEWVEKIEGVCATLAAYLRITARVAVSRAEST